MGNVVITIAMLVFVIGVAMVFYRSSKKPIQSDDGGRGIRDRSLAEAKSMQNRNDGLDVF